MSAKIDELNEDELQPPAWLTKEFFETVLNNHEHKDNIQVHAIEMKPATLKGDHYASAMFRAKVNYVEDAKVKERSLIIKTMPEMDGVKKDMLKDSPLFPTEIAVFTEIIPKVEAVLRSIGDATVFTANCLYGTLEPHKVVVFDDLAPMNYALLRDQQITLDETKLAFKKLAKWHAVSMKLRKEMPEKFAKFSNGCLVISGFVNSDYAQRAHETFLEVLNEVPELEPYRKYFSSKGADLLPIAQKFVTEYFDNPKADNTFFALCHGDFHFKNMLFRRSPSSDVKFCDFQISFMASVTLDLMYGYIMFLTPQQRLQNRNELWHDYFQNLRLTLEQIGYTGHIPNYAEFQNEYFNHKDYELNLVMSFLPMWYDLLQDTAGDVNKMMSDDEYRGKMYRRKAYVEELKLLLAQYKDMGYLDD